MTLSYFLFFNCMFLLSHYAAKSKQSIKLHLKGKYKTNNTFYFSMTFPPSWRKGSLGGKINLLLVSTFQLGWRL